MWLLQAQKRDFYAVCGAVHLLHNKESNKLKARCPGTLEAVFTQPQWPAHYLEAWNLQSQFHIERRFAQHNLAQTSLQKSQNSQTAVMLAARAEQTCTTLTINPQAQPLERVSEFFGSEAVALV